MIKPLVQDNIVALATPPGIGAIAVIRISGLSAKTIILTHSSTNSIHVVRDLIGKIDTLAPWCDVDPGSMV